MTVLNCNFFVLCSTSVLVINPLFVTLEPGRKFGMLDFPDSNEPKPICNSVLGEYKSAAVVSNTECCSSVGRGILEKGGSAVDAAIATLLCEGLCGMQNMGIGGGCFMTIYTRSEKRALCLDAREAAPMAATKNMFGGSYYKSTSGNLSVAVPGELMGYWEAHKKFGKLPWCDLFQPAISMCLNGIPVNRRLAKSFSDSGMGPDIMKSESLRKLLAVNGKLPSMGDTFCQPVLAKTLSTIANSPNGALELYQGTITNTFIRDLKHLGCIITAEDMNNYRAKWRKPVHMQLNEGSLNALSSPTPSSGAILLFILKILEDVIGKDPKFNIVAVAEAFKYGYALRTELGDPEFIDADWIVDLINSSDYIDTIKKRILSTKKTFLDPKHYGAKFYGEFDHGTTNIVVLAPNGDAVAATSTINTLFGSLMASEHTGIILNNEMDDFSSINIINSFKLAPSSSNFIAGGKRPVSSSCPCVIVDKNGDVRMVVGAAGGSYITSATAQVIMNYLWFGLNVKQAVDLPRIHHQLFPMALRYEEGIGQEILQYAQEAGHKLQKRGPSSSVTAIANNNGVITASYDYRRGGSTSGF